LIQDYEKVNGGKQNALCEFFPRLEFQLKKIIRPEMAPPRAAARQGCRTLRH
jgi:hypothetical protein